MISPNLVVSACTKSENCFGVPQSAVAPILPMVVLMSSRASIAATASELVRFVVPANLTIDEARAQINGLVPAAMWPEGSGVGRYSIFLDEETRDLFAYVEIEDEARWAAIAQTDVCRRWWRYMREIMPSNPDDSPVSRELREVFHIGKGRS